MASQEVSSVSKAKETSDRLMSIIRTLSYGADHEQRERQKVHLEKEYKESDKKVDKLVQGQHNDLTSIIQSYATISSRISSSQERIRAIKDNLQSCKNLLHCKRDELRKLWQEGQEHKMIVHMLDQIENIKHVSDKLQTHIDKRQYLHATDLLIKSTSLLENELKEVEGLHDIRLELQSKREELYEILMEALHKQIYSKPMTSVVQGFQRHGSMRASRERSDREKLLLKTALINSAAGASVQSSAEVALQQLMSVQLEDVMTPRHVTEDLLVDPELDPVNFLSLIVESLATLKKLPQAIDALRGQIRTGLLGIVHRASVQVYDNAFVEGERLSEVFQPILLLDVLKLVFAQFKVVARIHEIVTANMARVKKTSGSNVDFQVYNMLEVWQKIQDVLKMLLGDYLGARGAATGSAHLQHSTTTANDSDISAYFAKKRPQRPAKVASLFKFNASTHALSMDSYMREQRQEFYGTGGLLEETSRVTDASSSTDYVCKPTPRNLTLIYKPLQSFIAQVETEIRSAPGACALSGFLREFVSDIYLPLIKEDLTSNITRASKEFGSHSVIDLSTQKKLQVNRPLLQSTVAVARSVQELEALMQDIPDYSLQFIQMICDILLQYKQECQTAYQWIVLAVQDEKRIISATWAKDEDIGRFLRSLPNWRSLKDERGHVMSEHDQRAMNHKESSILTSNLSSSDALIPSHEIIRDVVQLRALSNLVESLEWLSQLVSEFVDKLTDENHQVYCDSSNNKGQRKTVSENTLMTLRSLSQHFQDLADLCLLVLHLETRVHCFYFLLPLPKQSNYSGAIDDMDPDSNVLQLNKDLASIEDALRQSLQPQKFRYIFEGLGHLVSTILINSTQYLRRINENGIKKMCRNILAIQQSLTNMTLSREPELDHARQYYELLYLRADDVIKVTLERGPQFTEQQYTSLLQLAQRSGRSGSEQDLAKRLDRLSSVLKEYECLV